MNKILIIVIVVVVVLAGGFFLFQQFTKSVPSFNPQFQQNQHGEAASKPSEQENGGYGFKRPFYRKDGISIQHYWPGEGNFSNEETEILLLNESSSNIEVKSFNLDYSVEGKTYPHKSGTWEKFSSKQSWDKIEYLNISPQYYKSEPLILEPGQKGKLHWHIQFGPNPLDGNQAVKVKLTLLKGSETITVDEQFNRDSGTVFSKENH